MPSLLNFLDLTDLPEGGRVGYSSKFDSKLSITEAHLDFSNSYKKTCTAVLYVDHVWPKAGFSIKVIFVQHFCCATVAEQVPYSSDLFYLSLVARQN